MKVIDLVILKMILLILSSCVSTEHITTKHIPTGIVNPLVTKREGWMDMDGDRLH